MNNEINELNMKSRSSVVLFLFYITLFLLGVFILFIRNPDPIVNRLIYAEDGVWIGMALSKGWFYTLLHARPDYFVFLNIIGLWLATCISYVLSGNYLSDLPQAIAIVSYAFYSAIAVLTYITVRKLSSTSFAILGFVLVLLMPIGQSQNEVIGRLLQIGFHLALLSVMLLFWRDWSQSKLTIYFINVTLLLAAASNPIILGIVFLYFIIDFFNTKKTVHFFEKNFSLGLSLAILTLILLPRLGGSGGIPEAFVKEGLIEAIFARSILYPFIYPWYNNFSDSLSLFFSLLLITIFTLAYCISKNKTTRNAMLLLFLSGVLYTAATLFTRPGLTSFFHHYENTYPDRYFMGINVIVVVLSVICISVIFNSRKLKLLGVALISFIVFLTIYGVKIIVNDEPWKNNISYNDKYLASLCTSHKIPPTFASIGITPPSWSMVVPEKYVDKSQCPIVSNDFSNIQIAEKHVINCSGSIDTINNINVQEKIINLSNTIEIHGWLAWSTSSAALFDSTFLVFTDTQGNDLYFLTKIQKRQDLANIFNSNMLSSSGFESKFDISTLKGEYKIGLVGKYDSSYYRCDKISIPINIK